MRKRVRRRDKQQGQYISAWERARVEEGDGKHKRRDQMPKICPYFAKKNGEGDESYKCVKTEGGELSKPLPIIRACTRVVEGGATGCEENLPGEGYPGGAAYNDEGEGIGG